VKPVPRPLAQRHRRGAGRAPATCAVPNDHVVLPRRRSPGVAAPIVVAFGDRFPMIHAHKVLAAYGCLAPRLVTGQFDPTTPPRGVAVDRQLLPRRRGDLAHHGLPRRRGPARGHERRALRLARALGGRPGDIVRTVGHREQRQGDLRRLRRARSRSRQRHLQPVLGVRNHLGHFARDRARARRTCSTRCARRAAEPALAAFVSATGSAGTIGAGDYLKDDYGARSSRSRRSSARRCSTTASASTTSRASATSTSRSSTTSPTPTWWWRSAIAPPTRSNVVFNTEPAGRTSRARGVPAELIARARVASGFSSICNVLAAIKTARAEPRPRRRGDHGGHRRRGHVRLRERAKARGQALRRPLRRAPRPRRSASTSRAPHRSPSRPLSRRSRHACSTSATSRGSSSRG
jgi:cysteine synthase A